MRLTRSPAFEELSNSCRNRQALEGTGDVDIDRKPPKARVATKIAPLQPLFFPVLTSVKTDHSADG
jgi:hypothetical protein